MASAPPGRDVETAIASRISAAPVRERAKPESRAESANRAVPVRWLRAFGQMQAASLLAKNSDPTKQEIVDHMDGNLCRCMTYGRIQKAIIRAAADMRAKSGS